MSQVQVFFWSDPKTPWWKVVTHKEPRSQWVMASMHDGNIETHAFGLEAPLEFVDIYSRGTLVGAIELSRGDTILVSQTLRASLGIDDA
jgi:hypothetical protein